MKQLWSPQELDTVRFFTFDDIALCESIRAENRLGFALQLKYLELEGRFPRSRGEIAKTVLRFVARQLDLPTEPLSFLRLGRQNV